jgi:hypothetical protein
VHIKFHDEEKRGRREGERGKSRIEEKQSYDS